LALAKTLSGVSGRRKGNSRHGEAKSGMGELISLRYSRTGKKARKRAPAGR